MTINYDSILTVDQKRSILQQRITQFAAEAYQHELNKTTCESLEDTAGVENAEKAIALLEKAIEVHGNELNSLPAPQTE